MYPVAPAGEAFTLHKNEGLPGVPSKAALAPARVKRPPSFRCFVAKWLEMVDVHILCFHIKSQFLKSAGKREKKNVNSSLPENNSEDKLNSHCPAPQEACQALLVYHGDLIKTAQGSVVRGTGLNTGHAVPWVSASSAANCQNFSQ